MTARILCTHSQPFNHRFYAKPLCNNLTTKEKVWNVVFNILTLCIPLIIYQTYQWFNRPPRHVVHLFEEEPVSPRPAPLNNSVESNSQPPANNICLITKTPDDILVYMMRFLSRKKLLVVAQTCKSFALLIKHDVLWKPHLITNRLWGADVSFQLLLQKGGNLKYIGPKTDAYLQLKVYKILGKLPDTIDYIARLMPGGPVAFQKLPILSAFVPSQISLDDMQGPIVRAEDHSFLALCVIDKRKTVQKPTLLILVPEEGGRSYKNLGNAIFDEGVIQTENLPDLNYILHIIQGDTNNVPQGFSQLELYDPSRRIVVIEDEKEPTRVVGS